MFQRRSFNFAPFTPCAPYPNPADVAALAGYTPDMLRTRLRSALHEHDYGGATSEACFCVEQDADAEAMTALRWSSAPQTILTSGAT